MLITKELKKQIDEAIKTAPENSVLKNALEHAQDKVLVKALLEQMEENKTYINQKQKKLLTNLITTTTPGINKSEEQSILWNSSFSYHGDTHRHLNQEDRTSVHLFKNIILVNTNSINDALQKTVENLQSNIITNDDLKNLSAGTTLTAAVCDNNKTVHAINIGDSRTIVAVKLQGKKNFECIRLTKTHNTSNTEECARVIKPKDEGGDGLQIFGNKIYGMITVTRDIGTVSINKEPEISEYKIPKNAEAYIIAFSDGVPLHENQIADILNNNKEKNKWAKTIASYTNLDNTSVVISEAKPGALTLVADGHGGDENGDKISEFVNNNFVTEFSKNYALLSEADLKKQLIDWQSSKVYAQTIVPSESVTTTTQQLDEKQLKDLIKLLTNWPKDSSVWARRRPAEFNKTPNTQNLENKTLDVYIKDTVELSRIDPFMNNPHFNKYKEKRLNNISTVLKTIVDANKKKQKLNTKRINAAINLYNNIQTYMKGNKAEQLPEIKSLFFNMGAAKETKRLSGPHM